MDEKRFDEILKQRLEAFQDKSPVPENLAEQVLNELPDRKKGIIGYWNSKPWLVAAAMGLVFMSMAAVLGVLYFQHESIEKLESEVAEIRKRDSIYVQPIEPENKTTVDLADEDPLPTPIQPNNQTPTTQSPGPLTNNTAGASPPSISIEAKSENKLVQSDMKENLVPISDFAYSAISIDRPINPIPLQSIVLAPTKDLYKRKQEIFEQVQSHPAALWSEISRPGFRIGLMTYAAKPRLDEGRANLYLMPGLKIESRMSQHMGISLGVNHGRTQYAVLHRPNDRRPSWFNRFPGIPPHDDRHPLTRVEVKSSFIELPVELRLYKGEIYESVSFFAGASLSAALYYKQQFTYKLKDQRAIPPVNQPNRQFEIANWSVSAGAQFGLTGQKVELSGFYKRSIMPQGIEKRDISQMGISAGIWFQ